MWGLKLGSREISQEVISVIQDRVGGSLAQVIVVEMLRCGWNLDILNIESTGFLTGLEMRCERKEGLKNDSPLRN